MYVLGFDMLVLTSGAWPLNQSGTGEFKVPAEVNMLNVRYIQFDSMLIALVHVC